MCGAFVVEVLMVRGGPCTNGVKVTSRTSTLPVEAAESVESTYSELLVRR